MKVEYQSNTEQPMNLPKQKAKLNLPVVALAGKKNAGKSSLLNALYGRSRAITDDYAGLTRDLLEVEIERYGFHFKLVDMPGLDLDESEPLEKSILDRARSFMTTVDALLLVFDAPVPAPIDIDLRQWLRKEYPNIPVVEVVNKIDNPNDAADILPNFFEVGLSPIPVSSKSRLNLKQICQELNKKLKNRAISKSSTDERDKFSVTDESQTLKDDSTIVSDEIKEDLRIALIGKPNVGKSSLFNRWIGRDLSIVSDIPGTTRDTVDTVFRYFGRDIRVIDTAGLRRQTKIKERPEFFSSRRTRRAIQDCHVVVQLLSAVDGITDYDKKIASLVQELSRPSIIVINKWDAINEKETNTQKEFLENVQSLFPHLKKIPTFFSSALTGKRAIEPLQKAIEVFDRSTFRVPTAKLNELVKKWLTGKQGIPKGFKLLYTTQTGRMPPVFVLFVNRTDLLPRNAIRYLENQIRDEFKLDGIPIRILVREKSEQNDKSDRPSKTKTPKKVVKKAATRVPTKAIKKTSIKNTRINKELKMKTDVKKGRPVKN